MMVALDAFEDWKNVEPIERANYYRVKNGN